MAAGRGEVREGRRENTFGLKTAFSQKPIVRENDISSADYFSELVCKKISFKLHFAETTTLENQFLF